MSISTNKSIRSVTYNGVNIPLAGVSPAGNKEIAATTELQTDIDVRDYATVSVLPTPSEQKSTSANGDVVPSSGKLLSKVTVNVPTGTQRSASDVTASGATVTVPAGLYGSQVQKSVASGTAGTPTASKGTVSNHSVQVTPSVINTEGYIPGGAKSGTPVTVTASELVSGSETKTENGTYDVTNLAQLVVDVQSGGGETIWVSATSFDVHTEYSPSFMSALLMTLPSGFSGSTYDILAVRIGSWGSDFYYNYYTLSAFADVGETMSGTTGDAVYIGLSSTDRDYLPLYPDELSFWFTNNGVVVSTSVTTTVGRGTIEFKSGANYRGAVLLKRR